MINHSSCISCGKCVNTCPLNVFVREEETKKIIPEGQKTVSCARNARKFSQRTENHVPRNIMRQAAESLRKNITLNTNTSDDSTF